MDETAKEGEGNGKLYTTLFLGTLACLSCFVFLFMIPFVLEPSISTLIANFDPDPVVCMTVHTEHVYGTKNCSWSSCKHGCTTDQYECDQIYVNYILTPYVEYDGTEYEEDDEIWDRRGLPLYVNIKSCGYPPYTNCTVFADEHAQIGTYFPCHYSRTNPNLVITDYSWGGAVNPMIMALLIPNFLTAVSLGVVSYWWYPGCQKRRCQYQLPPDQEETLSVASGGSVDDQDGILPNGNSRVSASEDEKDKETSINMPHEKA